MEPMEIILHYEGSKAMMKVEGSITSDNAYQFQEKLDEILKTEAKMFELDLANCRNISSTGIGKLLIFYKGFMKRNGEMEITKSSPNVYELLKTIKLDQLFTVRL